MSTVTVAESITSMLQNSWGLAAPLAPANIRFHPGWFDAPYDGRPQITVYGPIASPTVFFGPAAGGTLHHRLTFERYLVNIWKTIPSGQDGDVEEDYVELMRKEVVRILNAEREHFTAPAELSLVIAIDEGRVLHERDRVPRIMRCEITVQANYQSP